MVILELLKFFDLVCIANIWQDRKLRRQLGTLNESVPFRGEYFCSDSFFNLVNASSSFLRVWRVMMSMWCRQVVAHTSLLSTITHIQPFPAFVSKGYPLSPPSSLTLSSLDILLPSNCILPDFLFFPNDLTVCPFSPFYHCSIHLARLSCKSSSLFMINHKFLKYVKNQN